jgi:hypothetical protein
VPAPRDLHRKATRLLSSIMIAIGVLVLVLTIVNGGGPISVGVLLGVLFILAGALRLRVERAR